MESASSRSVVSGHSRWSYSRPSSRALPSRICAWYFADSSATESAPGSNALGASIDTPPVLVRLRRATAASFTPPFDGVHDSVWSRMQKIGLAPS